jgi:hypothetical protein
MRAVLCVRSRRGFVNASKGVLCRPSSYRGRRELEARPRQSPTSLLQAHSITLHMLDRHGKSRVCDCFSGTYVKCTCCEYYVR